MGNRQYKRIKQAKNYKVYVEAYKLVNGKKVPIGKTIDVHVSVIYVYARNGYAKKVNVTVK
ncbi:hypothetical protein KQI69_05645 [Eubacterium sp. MSJ-13]|uniref:hypothetical protein n=1 Tax=Eubacterium sp. MSJ-13 TaxID=2841513 RepID=UPI001C10DB76|nr:hypothetical protein [Eubacterium sp. MSJ-13]MBU5478685.1 hypothetical protein [Eubacterium sp. MSJ-13]